LKIDPRSGEETTVYAPAPKNAAAQKGSEEVRPSNAKSDAEAAREAKGVFTRTQQAAVMLTITMVGDASIVAKSIVEVSGLGKRLSGRYYVTDANHKLGSGYTLSLKMKADGTNAAGSQGAGKPNVKKADETKAQPAGSPPAPLQPKLVIDPRSGEEKTVYQDAKGREPAGGGK
jgi:hypothetical protein